MDEGDLAGEAGQECGLLGGGIAAPNDRDGLTAIEMAVAGRAGADAVPAERSLDSEPACRGSGRDDHCVAGVIADRAARGIAAGIVGGANPERPLRELDLEHGLPLANGPEALGLLAHQIHQVRAVDPVGKPREVVHGGRESQLAPGLLTLEDQGGQIGAGGVQGGGQSGGSRADDDQADVRLRRHHNLYQPTNHDRVMTTGPGWLPASGPAHATCLLQGHRSLCSHITGPSPEATGLFRPDHDRRAMENRRVVRPDVAIQGDDGWIAWLRNPRRERIGRRRELECY